MARDPNLDAHILQMHDLSREGQRVVETGMNAVGQSMVERTAGEIERLGGKTTDAARKDRASLEAIAPHVQNKPVTLQRAANSRKRTYNDALVRQQQKHESDQVIPEGADWYFEHHARIAHSADPTPFPARAAHYASAGMSPQNSPENERASVGELMHAHVNAKVHVTPEVVQHLAGQGIDVSHHEGQVVHADALPLGSLPHLSTAAFQSRVNTDANLREVSRGGVKSNITKGEHILYGEIPSTHEAFTNKEGVISAPKVASYAHVTAEAKPGSAVHVEYAGRVHQDALARAHGGGTGKGTGPGGRWADHDEGMDLYGLGQPESPEHLLSTRSHTVEDTWQNAVTFDQPKKLVGGGPNPTSVFKASGSGRQYPPGGLKTSRDENNKVIGKASDDPRVSPGMLLHAYNNRATQMAAEQQGRATGTKIPPTASQAVVWTEARRQAGKSREGGEAARSQERTHEQYQTEVDVFRRMGRTVPNSVREQPAEPSKVEQNYPGHVHGQMTLMHALDIEHDPAHHEHLGQLGGNVPPARRASSAEYPDMTPSQMEADLRKYAAIGSATRSRARRSQV